MPTIADECNDCTPKFSNTELSSIKIGLLRALEYYDSQDYPAHTDQILVKEFEAIIKKIRKFLTPPKMVKQAPTYKSAKIPRRTW